MKNKLNQSNPTLEEVIKEWKELGYEQRTREGYPYMIYLVIDYGEPECTLSIKINTQTKNYWKVWGGCLSVEPFTLEEHQLLTKTFRALGWEAKDVE